MLWFISVVFRCRVKSRLQELLLTDRELTPEEQREINPCAARSIEAALQIVGNPVRCCQKVYELVSKLVDIIRQKCEDPKTKSKSCLESKNMYDLNAI